MVRSLTALDFWAIQASRLERSPTFHRSRCRFSSLAQPSFRLAIWPACCPCSSCARLSVITLLLCSHHAALCMHAS